MTGKGKATKRSSSGMTDNLPIVLAVTGASGALYAQRLLEWLKAERITVHIVFSAAAEDVLEVELGERPEQWVDEGVIRHGTFDWTAPIASGSFLHRGMIICPCSMGTLAAVAQGLSLNLIHRAADVTLKERRPLILVPRESPLSVIHLENMLKAARAGVQIIPAMPAFYHRPETVEDLADTVAGRVLDALKLKQTMSPRWGGSGIS